MKGKALLITIAIAAFGLSFLGQWYLMRHEEDDGTVRVRGPSRIISMSPSITEVIFELGLQEDLVGVTTFCNYPPEAKDIAGIGGVTNTDYEQIRRLEPDLVVLRRENDEAIRRLQRMNIPYVLVDHETIEGILQSFTIIGRECGAGRKASEVVNSLETRMEDLRKKTRGLEKPSVMITIVRDFGTGKIAEVRVAGKDGYYSSLIDLAGGIVAFSDLPSAFPTVSAEGIIRTDPDIIIDTVYNLDELTINEEGIIADWNSLPEVSAVKSGRVHILSDSYAFIPGPRFILLAEKLAEFIHPELEPDKP